MNEPGSPTFSIGTSSANPSASESQTYKAKPRDSAPEGSKANVKTEDELSELEVRNYLPLESLLPTPEIWDRMKANQKAKRIRFLVMISLLYIILWIAHAPIAMWKAWSIARAAELQRLLDERPGLGQPLPSSCIVTSCAALCPEPTNVRDWYSMNGVPYATLPRQKSYFASANYPFTFIECYLAYWHGVAQEKRTFVNGQIRFTGKERYDDESECAQMKPTNGKMVPVGKPQSCLSLSFKFPWVQNIQQRALPVRGLPVVAYIGGSYLMEHRPRMISSYLASELQVFYVSINYRLGVFGFSDFGIEGSGPNHGVEDVRQALAWIQEHAHLFNADPDRVLLYGEDSGATIVAALLSSSRQQTVFINGIPKRLFTHAWISDGSVVIPDVPASKDAFREMVLNDPELEKICQEWTAAYGQTVKPVRSHPLARKYHCLSNVSVTKWLEKTPVTWLHSRKVDQTLLPRADEVRSSMIKREPIRTLVENPLGMLHPKSEIRTSGVADIPVVIFSSMNPAYNMSKAIDSPDYWSLSETEKQVKSTLNTFQKPTSQLPYADGIWNAYQMYLNNLIAWRKEDQAPNEINYRALYDIIRTDLRGTCAYNLYAKQLQLGGHIQFGPIYRILSRIRNQPYVDEDGARCDIPFFLIDEHFQCGEETQPVYEALDPDQKEVLIRAFLQFTYYGQILGAIKMQFPTYAGAPALETTYNVLSELGLTTAGSREIGMLSACKIWVSEEGEFGHVMKYARMN
ncbi:hypothetical protein CRM22_008579 [Opisthorchis felineus]|uniref:Carboxylesterase type B domain-containing protein n=1 Tax=Opisthorchis felineus TaxID=147828 RepID=A0A4S2LB82_OPIFE|nr:hypothetical protein CRM22_008579 [Opisthorchis felineus]